MLITKEVEINLVASNISYYENLNYIIPRYKDSGGRNVVKTGTKIIVKIEDLPKGSSSAIIKVLCDYCLEDNIETIIEKPYEQYRKQRDKEVIKKDCCKKCISKKNKEICIHTYGVERYSQVPEIKKKISKSQNHSYEFIKLEFERLGLSLVTNEYKNNNQDLEFKCNKHLDKENQFIKYSSLKNCKFGCKYCLIEYRSESQRHDFDFVKSKFESKNLILLENEYINETLPMKFECPYHLQEEPQKISFAALYHNDQGCKFCGYAKRSGENHWNWRGGICPLTNHLRQVIDCWKLDSMRYCNFKCVITGKRFDIVHHLYGFNEILQETFEELNLPILQNVNQYTEEELGSIENKFIEIHYRYPLGVCLTNEMHNNFHSIYGYGSNTPEQFEEFKKNKLLQNNIEYSLT